MMRAAVVRSFGGPEVIELLNIPKPEIKNNQILVRNHAAGVNPVDTYIRAGAYAKLPQLPYSPGKDGAGIIEQIGKDVQNFKVGDRVWYNSNSNVASAEYSVVDRVFSLPDDVSFSQGASLGVPYLTAYRALFYLAQAKPTDTILVHGASGGVGCAIIQFASWKNIRAIGTASSKDGIELIKSFGADNVYNHGQTGYIDDIKKDYPNGFNYIFEMAAQINLNTDLGLLAPRGKVAVIGNRAETTINARQLMATEGAVFGVALGLSTGQEVEESGNDVVRFLRETKFRPYISKEYGLEEVGKAHSDIISSSAAKGNIVIRID